jgi:hypothetical protein
MNGVETKVRPPCYIRLCMTLPRVPRKYAMGVGNTHSPLYCCVGGTKYKGAVNTGAGRKYASQYFREAGRIFQLCPEYTGSSLNIRVLERYAHFISIARNSQALRSHAASSRVATLPKLSCARRHGSQSACAADLVVRSPRKRVERCAVSSSITTTRSQCTL